MSEQDENNQAPENNTGDYEVGYKRPPKHSQFKKGQSGFAGRSRKNGRSYNQILAEELCAPLVIHENGRKKKITAMEGLAKKTIRGLLTSDKPREIVKFMHALPPEVLNAMEIAKKKEETANRIVEMLAEFGRDRERFRALKEEVGVDPYLLIEAMCKRLGIPKGNLTSQSENLVSAYLATIKTEKT